MEKKAKQNKRIRKDDKVMIITGNSRGMTGTVLSRSGDRAIVQGVNICKKHVRKSQENPQGGIVELENPIHISNIMICSDDDKPVKLKVRHDKEGQRELCYKKGKKEVKYRSLKKS